MNSGVYSIPASLKLALRHRDASGTGYPTKENRCECCGRSKRILFSYFKFQAREKNPNPSISLYLQYIKFCILTTFIMIILQLEINADRHYLSCKYYFKAEDQTSDCSFFDINTYLVTFWYLAEKLVATANESEIKEFVGILKNTLRYYI